MKPPQNHQRKYYKKWSMEYINVGNNQFIKSIKEALPNKNNHKFRQIFFSNTDKFQTNLYSLSIKDDFDIKLLYLSNCVGFHQNNLLKLDFINLGRTTLFRIP